MEKTDEELVREYQEGRAPAFDALVGRYARRVYAFALRLCGDPATAEDAAQETFFKAWKAIDRFDPARRFQPWLFQIARNASIDALRARKERPASLESQNEEGSGESDLVDESLSEFGKEADRQIDAAILEKALSELSADKRAVVILHDVEGLTFTEIADALGKPMNTVKSHYRRALEALRALLHQKGGAGRIPR
jgi:RNA polymerase sigma-70 factor (ECF subfamily)